MSKKIILSLIILVPFFLSSCGYKRLYESDEKKIYIKNIEVAGDTRIGYSLKNDILLSSSPNASNILNIELNIDRSKTVKNKNKSGKITKYTVTINAKIVIENIKTSKKIEKNFANSDVYEVLNSPSETLSNEKNSIKNITKQISEDITNFINFYYKD
tara:strand:+ start:150 stop:623 length:474 start_codon:yes stop_codon:yes gene_type:complete